MRTFKLYWFALYTVFLFSLGCVNNADNLGKPYVKYDYASMRMSPALLYVLPGKSVTVYGEGGSGRYTFSLGAGGSLGFIDPKTGIFTAGNTPGSVIALATDTAGAQASATIIILEDLVLSPDPAKVTTGANLQMSAIGGLPPYTFTLTSSYGGSINPTSGLVNAPTSFGFGVVQVEDAAGNKVFTDIQFVEPLKMLPASGFFASTTPLKLTRVGGEGNLTYTFLQGAGIVQVDAVNNILTPNPKSTGLVQLKVTDELGYSATLNLTFFIPKSVALGKRHTCAISESGRIYCWGGNDRGQIGPTDRGPYIGDDSDEWDSGIKAIEDFTNIRDIVVTGHSTCVLHSSNATMSCWGAKDNNYKAGGDYLWQRMGTWAEQNFSYGQGGLSNIYLSYTGDNYFLNFIAGSTEMITGYWNNFWQNVGDLQQTPITRANGVVFGESSKAGYKIELKQYPQRAPGETYDDSAFNFMTNGIIWRTYSGSPDNPTFSQYNKADIATFYGSYTSGSSSVGMPNWSSIGPIIKRSVSGNADCSVISIKNNVASAFQTHYLNKQRVACIGQRNYGGFQGLGYADGSAASYFDSTYFDATNDWGHNSSKVFTFNPANNYFSVGPRAPELINTIHNRSNKGFEPEALDVAVSDEGLSSITACGLFQDNNFSNPLNDGSTYPNRKFIQCWGSNGYGSIGNRYSGSLRIPPYAVWDGPSKLYLTPSGAPFSTVNSMPGGVVSTVDIPFTHEPLELFTNNTGSFCARTKILADGKDSLWCWGKNSFNEVGAGAGTAQTNVPREVFTRGEVGNFDTFAKIQLFDTRLCAIVQNGSSTNLWCMGDGRYGLITKTLNTVGERKTGPTRIKIGDNFNPIGFSTGPSHSCAYNAADDIKCWGARYFGQLGAYSAPIEADEPFETSENLHEVKLTDGYFVRNVFAGFNHTCAIMDGADAGKVFCFGANRQGELGRKDVVGDTKDIGIENNSVVDGQMTLDDDVLIPVNSTQRDEVIKMSAHYATFALTKTGQLFAWGPDSGSIYNRKTNTGKTYTDWHEEDKHLVEWSNLLGRGGITAPAAYSTPVKLQISSKVVTDVSTSDSFACVTIKNGEVHEGEVHCWGDNSRRQLGKLGTVTAYPSGPSPDAITGAGAQGNASRVDLGTNFKAIGVSTGAYHACAVSDLGKVKCWGNNEYGQLGLNYSNTRPQPVPYLSTNEMGNNLLTISLGLNAKGLPNFVTKIASGEYHTCALTDEGKIFCWGNNNWGQLGIGTRNAVGVADYQMGSALNEVAFPSGNVAIDVIAKGNTTCAVLSTNNVVCWGDNSVAQLGLGDRLPRGISGTTIGNNFNMIQFPPE